MTHTQWRAWPLRRRRWAWLVRCHEMLTEALRVARSPFGLEPRKDLDSFHVTDPDGLDIQVGDKNLGLDPGVKIG